MQDHYGILTIIRINRDIETLDAGAYWSSRLDIEHNLTSKTVFEQ